MFIEESEEDEVVEQHFVKEKTMHKDAGKIMLLKLKYNDL